MKKMIKKLIFNKYLVKFISYIFKYLEECNVINNRTNMMKQYNLKYNSIFNGKTVNFYGGGGT